MATVCEVCYVSTEGDYLDIFHEDHTKKNIAYILSKHLQCVNLEGIETPLICTACWTTLESFHGLYNLVEDLHRSQPESSSSSDDETEALEKEKNITYVDDPSYGEVKYKAVQGSEPADEDVETDEAAMKEVSEEKRIIGSDSTEKEDSSQEKLDIGENTEVDDDDDDDGDDGRHPKNCKRDSDLTTFYGTMFCQICELSRIAQSAPSISYDTFGDLKRHMLEVHHVGNIYLQCPLCSRRYYSRWELWQHMDMHKNPEKCGEVHQDLKTHVSYKHAKEQFECKECKRRYPSASRLATHAKVAHAPKDMVCNKCNKAFSKYIIKAHMRTMHGRAVYVCELCGKACRTIGVLNKHKMQHQSVATVACPVCKQLVRVNYIKGHMKLMHTERQPVACASCEKSFLNKRTLLVHQKRSCPANAYRCETCSKSFKTIAKLTEHQKTHIDSACIYYMCNVCMEKFDSKSLLYVHQQEMHKIKK